MLQMQEPKCPELCKLDSKDNRPTRKRCYNGSDARTLPRKSRRLHEQQSREQQWLMSAGEATLQNGCVEEQRHLPSPSPSGQQQVFCNHGLDRLQPLQYHPEPQNKPVHKNIRPTSHEVVASDLEHSEKDAIEHWIETSVWPSDFSNTDYKMSPQQLARKRSCSTMSYSQGVKEGIYPVAHTSEYEQRVLEPAGINLAQQIGEMAIGDNAKQLCKDFLKATYDIPSGSLFEGDLFWKIMESVRNESEGRIVRDIHPNLVPSPENLYLRGLSEINYLREKIGIQWSGLIPVAGPSPCPDFTIGLSRSAFTPLEIDKLDLHHTPSTPSRFGGDLYFPFFSCEAKCGTTGLNESDRQNARSAATAINAILQLYRRAVDAPNTFKKFHREALYFSISHDHNSVKIFSHYPFIKEDDIFFYRHLIKSFYLDDEEGVNRWLAYNFTRRLYDYFTPIHLDRIQYAVRYLQKSQSQSSMSFIDTEAASQIPDMIGASSSQEAATFKKPKLPAKEQESNQARQWREQFERQCEEGKQREERLLERLLEQHEEARRERDQLKELLRSQKHS